MVPLRQRKRLQIALAVWIVRTKAKDESVEDFIASMRRKLALAGRSHDKDEEIRVLREELARVSLKQGANKQGVEAALDANEGQDVALPARPADPVSSDGSSPWQRMSPTEIAFGGIKLFGVALKEVMKMDQALAEAREGADGEGRGISSLETTLNTLAPLTSAPPVTDPDRRRVIVSLSTELFTSLASLPALHTSPSPDPPPPPALLLTSLLASSLTAILAALAPFTSPEHTTILTSLVHLIFCPLIDSYLDPLTSQDQSPPPRNPHPLPNLLSALHPHSLPPLIRHLTTLLALPMTLPPSRTLSYSDLGERMAAATRLASLLTLSGCLALVIDEPEVEKEVESLVVQIYGRREVWGRVLGGAVSEKVEAVWRGWWVGEGWDELDGEEMEGEEMEGEEMGSGVDDEGEERGEEEMDEDEIRLDEEGQGEGEMQGVDGQMETGSGSETEEE